LLTLLFTLKIPKPSSHSLRLVTASNALPSTYYRSCWHVVSPGFSSNTLSLCTSAHKLYSYLSLHDFINLSSPQNLGSDFRLLTNILHCCQRQDLFHLLCDWQTLQPSYESSAIFLNNTYSVIHLS
jgi:hypothetical protein